MSVLSLWLSTFSIIFATIDPFGYVPIFLSMTINDTSEKRKWMLKRACLTGFVVLSIFAVTGNALLNFFGISLPALQISGGLILLVIGFDMLRVLPVGAKISSDEESEASGKDDISIVPLAIPMLSGPASMTGVIVVNSKSPSVMTSVVIVGSIFLTLAFTYIILRSSERILHRIGLTGLHIVTRVMGLLLCAMAVQFIINGYQAIR